MILAFKIGHCILIIEVMNSVNAQVSVLASSRMVQILVMNM